MVSKQEIIAAEIINRIHIQDKNAGGLFSMTTGGQGVGKTSSMLAFAEHTNMSYPKQKVFWSECYNAPLQWFKIKDPKKWNILIKSGQNIIFRDRDKHLEEIKFNVTYFDDFDDLWKKAKPGKINPIFFGDRFTWMEFIAYLRGVGEWVHVFIEELGEITPGTSRDELWRRIQDFSTVAKDIRKCMMNVHCNTQTLMDIDYRVRQKIMCYFFLPGAKVSRSTTRVTQRAVDNLRRSPAGNSFYVDLMGQFGVGKFVDIYAPVKGYHIDAHVIEDGDKRTDTK